MSEPVTLTPPRAVGAIERDLLEVVSYLRSTNPMAVDAELVKKHLEALMPLLDSLHTMQLSIQAAQGQQVQANGNGAEAVN